jgi:hypothetical protein
MSRLDKVVGVLDARLITLGISAQPVEPTEAANVYALSGNLPCAHRRIELGATQALLSTYLATGSPEGRTATVEELGRRIKADQDLGVPVMTWVHTSPKSSAFFVVVAETGGPAGLQTFLDQLFVSSTLSAMARI